MADTYTTADLAAAIIGEDKVEENRKSATRTLRKFLRDDMNEGKAVVGKGGRYALELNKTQVKAMAKRFAAWEAKQEADKAARAELKAAQAPKKSVNAIADDAVKGGDTVNSIADEELEDDTDEATGPTDDEIAAMLEDDELDEI